MDTKFTLLLLCLIISAHLINISHQINTNEEDQSSHLRIKREDDDDEEDDEPNQDDVDAIRANLDRRPKVARPVYQGFETTTTVAPGEDDADATTTPSPQPSAEYVNADDETFHQKVRERVRQWMEHHRGQQPIVVKSQPIRESEPKQPPKQPQTAQNQRQLVRAQQPIQRKPVFQQPDDQPQQQTLSQKPRPQLRPQPQPQPQPKPQQRQFKPLIQNEQPKIIKTYQPQSVRRPLPADPQPQPIQQVQVTPSSQDEEEVISEEVPTPVQPTKPQPTNRNRAQPTFTTQPANRNRTPTTPTNWNRAPPTQPANQRASNSQPAPTTPKPAPLQKENPWIGQEHAQLSNPIPENEELPARNTRDEPEAEVLTSGVVYEGEEEEEKAPLSNAPENAEDDQSEGNHYQPQLPAQSNSHLPRPQDIGLLERKPGANVRPWKPKNIEKLKRKPVVATQTQSNVRPWDPEKDVGYTPPKTQPSGGKPQPQPAVYQPETDQPESVENEPQQLAPQSNVRPWKPEDDIGPVPRRPTIKSKPQPQPETNQPKSIEDEPQQQLAPQSNVRPWNPEKDVGYTPPKTQRRKPQPQLETDQPETNQPKSIEDEHQQQLPPQSNVIPWNPETDATFVPLAQQAENRKNSVNPKPERQKRKKIVRKPVRVQLEEEEEEYKESEDRGEGEVPEFRRPVASGDNQSGGAAPTQPEVDPSTYNGYMIHNSPYFESQRLKPVDPNQAYYY